MSEPGPGGRPRRDPAEMPRTSVPEMSVPEMSTAEKLACEWEARHDVAARHRVGDVAPLQHYLNHVRCEDGRHAPAGTTHREASPERRAAQHDTGVPSALRGWLRWGEEGGPDAPIIPRC